MTHIRIGHNRFPYKISLFELNPSKLFVLLEIYFYVDTSRVKKVKLFLIARFEFMYSMSQTMVFIGYLRCVLPVYEFLFMEIWDYYSVAIYFYYGYTCILPNHGLDNDGHGMISYWNFCLDLIKIETMLLYHECLARLGILGMCLIIPRRRLLPGIRIPHLSIHVQTEDSMRKTDEF